MILPLIISRFDGVSVSVLSWYQKAHSRDEFYP